MERESQSCRVISKLSPFPGMQHLDVAGGTGDFYALAILELAGCNILSYSFVMCSSTLDPLLWLGDVAFRVLDAIYSREQMGMLGKSSDIEADDDTRVYVCDINPAMLNVGKQRAQQKGKTLIVIVFESKLWC